MHSVRFGCVSLIGRNKTGNLPRDENGYYEIVVGGLNVFNSANQYYPYDAARMLFESSGSLMRRVKRGVLRAEYGHPRKESGMRDHEFISRILQIHEDKVCGHFKELWLDFDRVKDERGQSVITIMAKFQPSGPYGAVLEKQFQNKDENVCFSVRSFTEDKPSRSGVLMREIKQIITFDYVNEPGIIHAEKYRSPGLEGHYEGEMMLYRDDFEEAAKSVAREPVAMESVTMSMGELFQAMNWQASNRTLRKLEKHFAPAWTRL